MTSRGVAFLGDALYGIFALILFAVVLGVFHFVMLGTLSSDTQTLSSKLDSSSYTLSALTYLRTPVVLHDKTLSLGDALSIYPTYSLSEISSATKDIYEDMSLCFNVFLDSQPVPLKYCSTDAEQKCKQYLRSLQGPTGHAIIDDYAVCIKSQVHIDLPRFDGSSVPLDFHFY